MTDTIKHIAVVESIQGSHLKVKLVSASACSTCSAKGYCTSVDSKEKIIDIIDNSAYSYQIGEEVMIVGETSIGMIALLIAYILPFTLLITSLFIFMVLMKNELYAGLASLSILIPYYYILWLRRKHLKRKLSFAIKPINS